MEVYWSLGYNTETLKNGICEKFNWLVAYCSHKPIESGDLGCINYLSGIKVQYILITIIMSIKHKKD
jgi:hypothetical protein